jgi:hypothetical protein
MPKLRDWSAGAKLLSASALGLLVSIGLCGSGSGWEEHGTPYQNLAATAGTWLASISLVLLLIGIVVFATEGRS